MYSNILYPTDGSEGADAALDDVSGLAKMYDATVHVLCVAGATPTLGLGIDPEEESNPGMTGNPKGGTAGMVGERRQELHAESVARAEEIVEDTAVRLSDVDTTTAVEVGEPHETILNYAVDNDIDMIVMGTHGRTGLERYLLGSVTENVVRLSDMPVVTVRQQE